MITASHLCKSFRGGGAVKAVAVDDVSLSVPAGDFLVIKGPSGSGKTTLLSMLGALTRPTSGSITVDGSELAKTSDVGLARIRRSIGFVFQGFSMLPRLPVWENMTYPLVPLGVRRSNRIDIAARLLDRFGLSDRMHSPPEELSGGEMQRVAVARALAIEPKILLADEPTSNLDPDSADSLIQMLRETHSTGVTVVISTHDSKLLNMATNCIELSKGRLV